MDKPDNPVMAEALAVLDSRELPAPKVPEGKTLIGVMLTRPSARKGRYMERIEGPKWQPSGAAVAIRDGEVIAANYLFGHVSKGTPKVTATHYVTCTKCGTRVLMPLAVWPAKDLARKSGIELGGDVPGMTILRKYGSCTCGGKWEIDDAFEKADLASFSERVLDALAQITDVPKFLPPMAWNVGQTVEAEIPQEWAWAEAALVRSGEGHLVPFKAGSERPTLVYNPGLWLGWVDHHHDTGLFWVERGSGRDSGHGFDPGTVEGL